MHPTLILPAHNRPHALQRLLHALQQAIYPGPTRLVIVIDGGGEHETAVTHTAHQFQWHHGRKEIIHQRQNIGLIGNVFYCGDLSQQYGSIILLEDQEYEAAGWLLRRAEADAELAIALAKEHRERQQAEDAMRKVKVLKQEMQR